MGYLHTQRVHELHNLGLADSEIKHKITQEFGIRLTTAQIENIYTTVNTKSPKQEVERTKHLSTIIEEIIKGSSSPLKARAIATKIRGVHGERVTKSEINKIIYRDLRDKVIYNPYLFNYKWKVTDKVNTNLRSPGEIVRKKIESIIGAGVDVMQSLIDRQHTFDVIFIDADKNNYPNYYELSLSLVPSNGIIIIDNMLWHGDVADTSKNDSQTKTIRDLNLQINQDDRVEFSLLPLSDGLSFIRKK